MKKANEREKRRERQERVETWAAVGALLESKSPEFRLFGGVISDESIARVKAWRRDHYIDPATGSLPSLTVLELRRHIRGIRPQHVLGQRPEPPIAAHPARP